MSIHGHRVLEMMAGKSYTEDGLLKEIHANFGEEALFHTCSAENMDATQLIGFLKRFMQILVKRHCFTPVRLKIWMQRS